MKNSISIVMVLSALLWTGCRSDADKMAEFCLEFDRIAENAEDCDEMAIKLDEMLSKPQHRIKDKKVCEDSTACLPCKHAARIMLGRCGTEPGMRTVLDEMNFSKSLREL